MQKHTPTAASHSVELKRFEEALQSYDRAIQLGPDHAEAHSNRGIALGELKRSKRRCKAMIARSSSSRIMWKHIQPRHCAR